jgi:hypothetical protein
MTFGTCDSPPSALRQARLGRSLPEDASDAVPIAYVRFHSASTRLATLQTAHVPIRLRYCCIACQELSYCMLVAPFRNDLIRVLEQPMHI